MTNLPAALSTLQTEISELTERLSPAGQDNVSDAISTLLAAGLSLPAAMDRRRRRQSTAMPWRTSRGRV